jgi:type VI secretion system protein ImpJ
MVRYVSLTLDSAAEPGKIAITAAQGVMRRARSTCPGRTGAGCLDVLVVYASAVVLANTLQRPGVAETDAEPDAG